MNNFHGGCVLVDGNIYGNHEYSWNCLDFMTGELMYSEEGIKSASIIFADGMLYCLSEKGTVALLEANPKEYQIVSRFELPNTGPETWAQIEIEG